jgi:hypothetical protein
MIAIKNAKIVKVLLFFAIILVIISVSMSLRNNNKNYTNDQVVNTEIIGNDKDLVSLSIDPGSKVSGIMMITGSAPGSYFFEGNILVNILNSNKELLKGGNGNAKTDWMTSGPVGFDAVLDFSGLKKGEAYIEIHNDNASGLPENDKTVLIPIIITK